MRIDLHFFQPRDLAGRVAIVVAVLALAVTFWQGWEQRRHNRLSATPHLSFRQELSIEHGDGTPGLYLTNTGIGPAIIECVAVALDGEVIISGPPVDWRPVLEASDLAGLDVVARSFRSETWMPARESFLLIGIARSLYDESHQTRLRNALARIDVCVQYRSAYGEVDWTATDAELEWSKLLRRFSARAA